MKSESGFSLAMANQPFAKYYFAIVCEHVCEVSFVNTSKKSVLTSDIDLLPIEILHICPLSTKKMPAQSKQT